MQGKVCGKKRHTKTEIRSEISELICGRIAAGENYNLTRDIKGLAKDDPGKASRLAEEIIKNTYRTLMTRGMKGCYVYCTDSELAAYLKERLKTEDKNDTGNN